MKTHLDIVFLLSRSLVPSGQFGQGGNGGDGRSALSGVKKSPSTLVSLTKTQNLEKHAGRGKGHKHRHFAPSSPLEGKQTDQETANSLRGGKEANKKKQEHKKQKK